MSSKQVFVVRRGGAERFQSLRETFAGPPISAAIIWDRRATDRRHRARVAASDRRRAERRGPEPSSWTALEFLVTGATGTPPVEGSGVGQAPANPVDGDLLVLRETSVNGPCSVSTVPGPAHVLLPSYEQALAHARRLAARVGVSVWYTEDNRVFTVVSRGPVQPPRS